MANTFKDISQFTLKSAATGTEEFQVSATEKVTAQQIADLASSGLNVYTISESESQNQKIDASRVEELKKSAIVLFPNEVGYTPYLKVSADDSKAYFITGIIPINSQGQPGINNGEEPPFEQVQTVMIEVDLTTRDITVWPYPVVKKEWLQTSDIIEVGDFTTINEIWPTKTVPGTMCPFYTGSEVYSAPDATETKYVGFVILDSDFATQGGATVVAIAQTSGIQYVGKLDFNGQSIDWCATVNNPVTVTDFKSLPNFVKTAKDGEIIPIIAPASASNGPTGLVSLGPAYGYVQVAKTGSTKAYNFLIQMDSAGNGPRMYTGFVNTVANLIYWLPLNSEESSTIAPVSITEYGDIYGTTAIGENPAGTIVPWYAQGTNVDGDMGPFGGEASRVDGIYITVEGDNGSNNGRSGYLVAYGADHEGMAYCQVSGTTDNGGGVANISDWVVLKPSSDIDLNCPIPGYTKVNGGTIDCSLTNGSTTVVSLTKAIPNNSICFIEADVLDKVTGGSIKTSAPLMFFRYASGATMCDINSKALAGSNISAQVKLNVATITGNSSFVVVSTCYNLDSSISSGVCRIKNIYALI